MEAADEVALSSLGPPNLRRPRPVRRCQAVFRTRALPAFHPYPYTASTAPIHRQHRERRDRVSQQVRSRGGVGYAGVVVAGVLN